MFSSTVFIQGMLISRKKFYYLHFECRNMKLAVFIQKRAVLQTKPRDENFELKLKKLQKN